MLVNSIQSGVPPEDITSVITRPGWAFADSEKKEIIKRKKLKIHFCCIQQNSYDANNLKSIQAYQIQA